MSRQRPKSGRPSKRQRQTACGKRRYRDHAEAIAALRLVRSDSVRGRVPVRTYECGKCGGWHLTSQER